MNPAGVFERAAQEIERRGHHKGAYGDDRENPDTCRVCLYGALNVAVGLDPFNEDVPLPREVEAHVFVKVGNCPDVWNDAPSTTADDVVGLLRDLAREVAS